MSGFAQILLLGAVIYLCRLSGFVVALPTSAPWIQDALRFVPVAVFAALVVPSLTTEPEIAPAKLLALLAAGTLYLRTRNLGLSLLVGLIVLWLLLLPSPIASPP